MSLREPLLSEFCRPKVIDDLNLASKDINFLKAMFSDKGKIKNLLFYGRPGTGKTSAALVLTQGMELSAMTLNAGTVKGVKNVKKFIEEFFSATSFDGNFKTLIINEADKLKVGDQTYLLEAIERHAENGRFILTANDVSKVSEPVRSRLTSVCFDVGSVDRPAVIAKMVSRYCEVLNKTGTPLPAETISKIVHIYFPDLRATANMLEKEIMSSGVDVPEAETPEMITSTDGPPWEGVSEFEWEPVEGGNFAAA